VAPSKELDEAPGPRQSWAKRGEDSGVVLRPQALVGGCGDAGGCESGDGYVEDTFSPCVGAEWGAGDSDDVAEDVMDGEVGVGVSGFLGAGQ
jgi:hypothetical protein